MDKVCVLCWLPASHQHHIKPRSHGGTDDPANLVWLCAGCHSMVHHDGPLKWVDKLQQAKFDMDKFDLL